MILDSLLRKLEVPDKCNSLKLCITPAGPERALRPCGLRSTNKLMQKDFSWSKHLPRGSPSEMGLCNGAVIIDCSLRKWISSVTHKAVVFKILKII